MAKGQSRGGAQKSPRDHTGRQAEQLQAEHADEIARRQGELGMLNAAQVVDVDPNEIEDYTVGAEGDNADLSNQTVDVVHQAVTGEPLAPHLRGTTAQPGQTFTRPTDTGGGTAGQANVTAGTIDAQGYMMVGNEKVKTNSTPVTGTGYETPSHVPGSTAAGARTRGTVDTQNATVVGTVNYGIKGLSADDVDVQDLGEVPDARTRGAAYSDEPIVIEVNTDLEGVTYGNSGKILDFFVGRRYRVPGPLAAHLEEKGYVRH